MAPVIALLVITLVSLLVVRVGATALMMTGLSWDSASFQSYSAFFGVGFTTREAELVVNHPVRRRIIRDLIFAGNIGLTSALAALVVTLLQTESTARSFIIIGGLIIGLVLIIWLFRFGWLRRFMDRAIQHALERAGLVRALDYELLLRVQAGYCVSEIEVLAGTFLADRLLRESRPWDRGIVILAIKRDNATREGLPGPQDEVRAGDVVTAYGQEENLRKLTDSVAETNTTAT